MNFNDPSSAHKTYPANFSSKEDRLVAVYTHSLSKVATPVHPSILSGEHEKESQLTTLPLACVFY